MNNSTDYNGAYTKFSKADLKPKGSMLTTFNIVSALVMLLGLIVIIARFALGLGGELNILGLNLGPITNLNQDFPWGLWISFDVLVGIAFAGGAYTLTVIVYMLGQHKYHPIMRSVVLGGFLAYTFYAAALILDLGRPWNALNFVIHIWEFLPFESLVTGNGLWSPGSASMGLVILWFVVFAVMVIITEVPQYSKAKIVQSATWKIVTAVWFAVMVAAAVVIWKISHNYEIASVLFMVAWHFLMYDICLLLEFSPAFAEWFNSKKLWGALKSLYMAAAIIGVTLCMGHQAGVGGIFLLAPFKIHPLWYSGMIPMLFVVSSFFTGLCFVMLEGSLAHKVFDYRVSDHHNATHDDITYGLAKISVFILTVYFVLKMIELGIGGSDEVALLNSTYGYWYLTEIIGFVLIPALVFMRGIQTRSMSVVKYAAGLTLIGVALNRFNISMLAYNFEVVERYVPTIMELCVTFTVVFLEVWVYRLIVNRLPVLGETTEWAEEH